MTTCFEECYFPEGVLVDGTMYPTHMQTLKHAVKYLTRNAVMCCLFLYFVFKPFYDNFIVPLNLGEVGTYIFTIHFLCHFMYYELSVGFYFFLDNFKILQQYRHKRTPAQEPSQELLLTSFRESLFLHLVLAPVGMYVGLHTIAKTIPVEAPLPSLPIVFLHFVAANMTNEIVFFSVHCLVHHPKLYFIHKKHHQYIGPRAVAAEHATILEELTANIGATLLYCTVMQVPLPLFGVWLLSRLTETFEVHSGYYFRGSLLERMGLTHAFRADFHDFHHTQNAGNYGTAIFMDFIFRTMTPYIRSKQRARAARERKEKEAITGTVENPVSPNSVNGKHLTASNGKSTDSPVASTTTNGAARAKVGNGAATHTKAH